MDALDRPTTKANAQEELLLAALAAGQNYAQAGTIARLSERTVRRRMADPSFAAEVARRRTEHVANVTGLLLVSATRAVEVVRECLESEKPSDRLRAAELMLTLGRRYHDSADEEARLLALEVATGLTDATGGVPHV